MNDNWIPFSLSSERADELKPQIDRITPYIVAFVRNHLQGYLIANHVYCFELGGEGETETIRAAMQQVGFEVHTHKDEPLSHSGYSEKPDPKKLGEFMLSMPRGERRAFQTKVNTAVKKLLGLADRLA
ncbi:MAG: hypothetical protein WCV72_05070 [Patescibacteria group bacterium]